MNFKRKKYQVIKKIISKDLAIFLHNYLLLKRRVAKKLFDTRFISPFTMEWGRWDDDQVPNTYCCYADLAMETLLVKVQPYMEKETKLKLLPNYSFVRMYKHGDVLERHLDRSACSVSCTLNLGGEPWPIYLLPKPKASKAIEVILKPGDMLIYAGRELEHWRDSFKGTNCGQVFLHYGEADSQEAIDNCFDTRPFVGLPVYFKSRVFIEQKIKERHEAKVKGDLRTVETIEKELAGRGVAIEDKNGQTLWNFQ